MRFTFLLILLFSLSACATTRNVVQERVVKRKPVVKKIKIKKLDRVKRQAAATKVKSKFPLDAAPKDLRFWKSFFSKKDKARFLRFLANGYKYKDAITKIFKANDLPEELYYVGLIESGYYSRATSHAGAQGPWQFMKGTGKHYGLRVDRAVDERNNIHKATQAAASYFKDLYNIFGSWELALSAYNAGEYRIIKAIRKGNTRSYRELVKKRLIPRETANYVPKVAAAMEVSKYLERKAVKNSSDKNLFKGARTVKLTRSFNINKLAGSLKVSRSVLKKLNPDLKHSWVNVLRKGHYLMVPKSVKSVGSYYHSRPKSYSVARKKTHKVRRGQFLSYIAKKHKVSVRELKRMNNLRSSKIFPGQVLTVSRSVAAKRKNSVHKVRRGEHLTLLANKYGVSIRKIKKANSIRRNTLYVGELIKIPQG